MTRRVRLHLRGIVQGVGLRPFVFNLAQRLHLTGYVLNSSAGLIAEAEGEAQSVEIFLHEITETPPPLAWIQHAELTDLAPAGDFEFTIRHSVDRAGEFALISPDVATCPACAADFTDPANRRFGCAFTNCTNCGPRYTIVEDIPYDRPNTTMAKFRMCDACRAEYDNPADRRFHAQPNACAACGPRLSAPVEDAIAGWPPARSLPLKASAGSTWHATRETPSP